MVLDPSDPKKVTSLTVFVEGDDAPVKTPTKIHQPDNLESTRNGLLVTEDPGSSQQFTPGDPNGTPARLMYASYANPNAAHPRGQGEPDRRRGPDGRRRARTR